MEKKFTKGKPAKASQINEIVHSLERANNMTAEQPIEIIRSQTGVVFRLNRNDTMFAKITSGANPYAWTEMLPGTGGTWTVRPGGLSGTTTDQPAYEVNQKSTAVNKIVKMYRGVFGEWLFEKKGHGSTCSVALTIRAICGTTGGGLIAGALIELLDSTGVTVLASCTGTSCTFTIDGTLSYKYRVSKAGYHTKTYSLSPVGCITSGTIDAYTWPSTFQIPINVYLVDDGTAINCPVDGATVTITGDASGSGVTNSAGFISVTASTTSLHYNQTFDVYGTPPSGVGGDVSSTTTYSNINPCPTQVAREIRIPKDSSHVHIICGSRYMPNTFSYSDTEGSCTITYNSGSGNYEGSFTTSGTGGLCVDCPGPPPFQLPQKNQAISYTVFINFNITSNCNGAPYGLLRTIPYTFVYDPPVCSSFSPSDIQISDDIQCNGTVPCFDDGLGDGGTLDCSTPSLYISSSIADHTVECPPLMPTPVLVVGSGTSYIITGTV